MDELAVGRGFTDYKVYRQLLRNLKIVIFYKTIFTYQCYLSILRCIAISHSIINYPHNVYLLIIDFVLIAGSTPSKCLPSIRGTRHYSGMTW